MLDTGLFSVNSATPVNYSNKQSITVDGAAGEDIITLQGDINATSAITLSAETVASSTTATTVPTLTTDTLTLSAVNNAGSADNRLRTDIQNLRLTNSGASWLDNRGDLNISQMSAIGTTNIIATGNITSSAALTSDNSLTLETATGNISLNNSGNVLRGPIALMATAGDITFNSGSNTELANISAKNLTLNIAGDINSNGTINVTGNSQLTASNNITLTGSNDFNTITLSGNNLLLHDNNTLNITRINARGSATLKANNNINVGNITAPQVTLNSSSGQIIDNNGSALNISADKIVLRANSGIGVGIGANEGLETETAILDIINQTGNINISNRGNVQINNLVTQGDITLKNQQNVTVDTIDAGYENGKIEIEIANGSLYGYSFIPNSVASQRNYKTVPDITANIASIKTTGEEV